MIEIRDLSKSFNGHAVLKDVNLVVEKGSTVVILGKSGVGKSVLLKTIIGLMPPDTGSIRIDGQEVVGMDRRTLDALRKQMGYLFQGAALYDSMTVRENLAFPLERQARLTVDELEERILRQLGMVGLEDAIDKMPAELSGGMKKRIGLARALINNPRIMFYDEPTTGLDPITAREISYLIKELQQLYQPTSIAVTHDMMCARIIADKAAVLHDGVIEYEGTISGMESVSNEVVKSFLATA
ncbi:MAG: ATP-binding cassette domain-containing protein [Bacteroidota bacterium]